MADERSKPGRQLIQMPRFERLKKRLLPSAQLALDEAVREVMNQPLVGELKKGALRDVRIHKFKAGNLPLLFAYKFDAKRNVIEAWAVGPHENFYRDLQKYLDAR